MQDSFSLTMGEHVLGQVVTMCLQHFPQRFDLWTICNHYLCQTFHTWQPPDWTSDQDKNHVCTSDWLSSLTLSDVTKQLSCVVTMWNDWLVWSVIKNRLAWFPGTGTSTFQIGQCVILVIIADIILTVPSTLWPACHLLNISRYTREQLYLHAWMAI